jgi:hypothetical protein
VDQLAVIVIERLFTKHAGMVSFFLLDWAKHTFYMLASLSLALLYIASASLLNTEVRLLLI